jgi:hypothetical protein
MPASKFTKQTTDAIIAYIARGAFWNVAAQAVGINSSTLANWLEKGERAEEGDPYRDFFEAIMTARAVARAGAETVVYEADPKTWLLYGPGRERPGEPGWSRQTQVTGPDAGPITVRTVWGTAADQAAAAVALEGTKKDLPALPELASDWEVPTEGEFTEL